MLTKFADITVFYIDVNTNEINLSNQNIVKLNGSLCDLRNLNVLKLNNNNFTEFESDITNLTNLKVLNIRNNYLFNLPSEIVKNKNLEILDVGNNLLNDLPTSINELTSLKFLNIGNNFLTSINIKINDMKKLDVLLLNNNFLCDFRNLTLFSSNIKILNLASNFLRYVPHSIYNFSELKELNLENNLLTKIPKEIGYIYNLKILNLRNNCLTKIPTSFLNLKKSIEFFILSGNLIINNGYQNFFGKFELFLIFGKKIILENQLQVQSKVFLSDIWNHNKIYLLKNTLFPRKDYKYQEIIKIWNLTLFMQLFRKKFLEFCIFIKMKKMQRCFLHKYMQKLCYLKAEEILNLISKHPDSSEFDIFMVDKFDNKCSFEDSVVFNIVTQYKKKIYIENFLFYLFNSTCDKTKQFVCLKNPKSFNIGKIIQKLVHKEKQLNNEKNQNILTPNQKFDCIYCNELLYNDWTACIEIMKKNILSIILVISVEESVDLIERYLEVLYKTLLLCPSKQKLEFKIYLKLINNDINADITIVDAIEMFIGELKLTIFDAICITEIGKSNVGHIDKLRYIFRNKLGFNITKHFQEPYLNSKQIFTILKFFYSTFTPEYVIVRLTFWINNDKKLLKLTKDWLFKNLHILKLPKNYYFSTFDDNVEEIKGVTEILIREILINMNLVICNFEDV